MASASAESSKPDELPILMTILKPLLAICTKPFVNRFERSKNCVQTSTIGCLVSWFVAVRGHKNLSDYDPVLLRTLSPGDIGFVRRFCKLETTLAWISCLSTELFFGFPDVYSTNPFRGINTVTTMEMSTQIMFRWVCESSTFTGCHGIVNVFYIIGRGDGLGNLLTNAGGDYRLERFLKNLTPNPGIAHVVLLDFDRSDVWVQELRERPTMPEGINLVLVGRNELGHIVVAKRIDEEAFTDGHKSPEVLAIQNELVGLQKRHEALAKETNDVEARMRVLRDK